MGLHPQVSGPKHRWPPNKLPSRPGLLVAVAALAAFGLVKQMRITAADADSQLALFGLKQMNVSRSVKESFPGAMKGSAVFSKVLRALRPYGVRRKNTIYGQSIGPDAINGDKGHLTTLMREHFGHVFELGGLGGVPFVGKTGFTVFSSHVPDDGNVVLVFGPNIGYTMGAEPGKFHRKGQAATSPACGALVAAYNQLASGSVPADPQDSQQSWLRMRLKRCLRRIRRSESPMVELAKEAYKIVEKEVMAIVNNDFGSGNLVLIGGITINMPYPMNGFFLPLHFSVSQAHERPTDLMSIFG